MTDCDQNLLAVFELRRWKDGDLPPYTEQESIQMLHILLWGNFDLAKNSHSWHQWNDLIGNQHLSLFSPIRVFCYYYALSLLRFFRSLFVSSSRITFALQLHDACQFCFMIFKIVSVTFLDSSDGITIGTAIEHEELKKEKELGTIFEAFENELLQQMNLLWYKVGKLRQVLQRLLPRVRQ